MKIPDTLPVAESTASATYIETCPKCGQMQIPQGSFLFAIIPVEFGEILEFLPLPGFIKGWIKRMNVDLFAILRYCPRCGFLQLKVKN